MQSWTKGHIFNLTDFDAVLYLDGDTIFRKSIDFLFEPSTSIVAASLSGERRCSGAGLRSPTPPGSWFNTGVVLVKPSQRSFNAYVEAVAAQKSCPEDGSQTTENNLFKTWKDEQFECLSPQLNCRPVGPNEPCIADAFVLHWSGNNKPWNQWWDETKKAPKSELSSMQKKTVYMWRKAYTAMLEDLGFPTDNATADAVKNAFANEFLYCDGKLFEGNSLPDES